MTRGNPGKPRRNGPRQATSLARRQARLKALALHELALGYAVTSKAARTAANRPGKPKGTVSQGRG